MIPNINVKVYKTAKGGLRVKVVNSNVSIRKHYLTLYRDVESVLEVIFVFADVNRYKISKIVEYIGTNKYRIELC